MFLFPKTREYTQQLWTICCFQNSSIQHTNLPSYSWSLSPIPPWPSWVIFFSVLIIPNTVQGLACPFSGLCALSGRLCSQSQGTLTGAQAALGLSTPQERSAWKCSSPKVLYPGLGFCPQHVRQGTSVTWPTSCHPHGPVTGNDW